MPRLSIRGMLVLVALVAVAIVSLTYASSAWQAVVGAIAMGLFFGAVIVAAVDRGERQAFAIGGALVMLCYCVIVTNGATSTLPGGRVRNYELDPWEGRLPTTQLLRYVHIAVDRSRWIDSSGKVIPNFDPSNYPGGGFSGVNFGVGGPRYVELPPREVFMPIGHMWWALLLGFVGGWMARLVYLRRTREQESLAGGRS